MTALLIGGVVGVVLAPVLIWLGGKFGDWMEEP